MIKDFIQAQDYLISLIDTTERKPSIVGESLKRTQYLLKLLGDPQNKLKVIHIAGTSGKGSTAFYIAELLHAHGFKVGLHVSPHLVDIRERCQIDNKLITSETFVKYINILKPIAEKMSMFSLGKPTYFETTVCLAYLIFHEEKVDYAVIETGCGGLYDATNTVSRSDKLAVLTHIGLDHMELLGDTEEKIAFQKANIIQKGNITISHWNTPTVRDVIERIATHQKSTLIYIKQSDTYPSVKTTPDGVIFDYRFGKLNYENVKLATIGDYQAENASFALTALNILSHRDTFAISEKAVRSVLERSSFPGRMELIKLGKKTVILDGAHNSQKMDAFLSSLKKAFPHTRFHFLIAFKKGKNYPEMVDKILVLSKSITVTNFVLDVQDMRHRSQDPQQIVTFVENSSAFRADTVGKPTLAFDHALKKTLPGEIMVVTGSLYLLSCLYNHIYTYTHRK